MLARWQPERNSGINGNCKRIMQGKSTREVVVAVISVIDMRFQSRGLLLFS